MNSYRDPALRGAVYPSEEEIDPAGAGVEPASGPAGAYASQPGPQQSHRRGPAPKGTAYAVWVGVRAALTVAYAMFTGQERCRR